jgi:hypothetical protein
MLLTALATFLLLAGVEVLVFAGLQAWLAAVLGPAGAVLSTLLMVALPVFNLFVSWYAARRICLLLWPDLARDAEQKPAQRRRLVGQQGS